MSFTSYFRDRRGKQTVFQRPNLPLLAWAGFGAASSMALTPRYRTLLHRASQGSMMWWAAGETFRGRSPFRRTIGAATLMRSLRR
ncbi:hypothetical protein [Arthrobacter caoxuetaonis]|uniref:Uncharacterized protein n=1 Tax=Arthrobacter caoxuetaonis TaxID=2886935 RepID=A0A9X1MG57_9MICC|nr:hypothetical protein [Arthrobacter caoxuetaonis]MCC3281740.1 hypothetical protein [Arthrobacter caoxuetaonis]MCC3298590.1 hypothetical protein [Arthrobacter caoxuetaonis]USQ57331.1 hypothetical protein NF551_00195 [Arthrobacter caoxuetaonis]